MLETYRRSLKMPEAEELFDLIFYRPLAYLLVVPLSKTPVTPNQVTILSLLAGLIAAYYISIGIPTALILGAIWYALANILDCADGQLARINKNGTPLGRVVDGVADYISSVAIFLGIGFGFGVQGNPQWWLVIAAGISSAIHAIKFDEVQSSYIANAKGESDVTGKEMEKYSARLVDSSLSSVKRLTLTLYLMYLKFQQKALNDKPQSKNIVRLWSWLGPTTNRTLLIVAALLGDINIFLYGVVLAGNAYFFLLTVFIRRR